MQDSQNMRLGDLNQAGGLAYKSIRKWRQTGTVAVQQIEMPRKAPKNAKQAVLPHDMHMAALLSFIELPHRTDSAIPVRYLH